jgi:endonuclease V-like protein UPF0215 family
LFHGVSSDIKQVSKCIGIDDGPFPPKTDDKVRHAPLIAVRLKGPHLQQIITDWITVDGLDATRKAEFLLRGAHHIPVLLSGVTFGGFNLIDPWKVQKLCKSPVVVVVGSQPNNRAVKHALLKHFPDWEKRWELIRSLGPLHKARTMTIENPVFFEQFGCSTSEARSILKASAFVSRVPEPLRVAGVLARALFSSEPSG